MDNKGNQANTNNSGEITKAHVFFSTKGIKNTNKSYVSMVVSENLDGTGYILHKTSTLQRADNQFEDLVNAYKFAVTQAKGLKEEYDTSDVTLVFCTEVQALYKWLQQGKSKAPYDKTFDAAYNKMLELPYERIALAYSHTNVAKNYCKDYYVNIKADVEDFEDMVPVYTYLKR